MKTFKITTIFLFVFALGSVASGCEAFSEAKVQKILSTKSSVVDLTHKKGDIVVDIKSKKIKYDGHWYNMKNICITGDQIKADFFWKGEHYGTGTLSSKGKGKVGLVANPTGIASFITVKKTLQTVQVVSSLQSLELETRVRNSQLRQIRRDNRSPASAPPQYQASTTII